MQWTSASAVEGTHLLLQVRRMTLNEELVATLRHWYPDFQPEVEVQLTA